MIMNSADLSEWEISNFDNQVSEHHEDLLSQATGIETLEGMATFSTCTFAILLALLVVWSKLALVLDHVFVSYLLS